MTLIIQQSYFAWLGEVVNIHRDDTEEEWRYIVDLKFTTPNHKKMFEVMVEMGQIRVELEERILSMPLRPPRMKMFAIHGDKSYEFGDCYIAQIPLTWSKLKDMDQVQLCFCKEKF